MRWQLEGLKIDFWGSKHVCPFVHHTALFPSRCMVISRAGTQRNGRCLPLLDFNCSNISYFLEENSICWESCSEDFRSIFLLPRVMVAAFQGFYLVQSCLWWGLWVAASHPQTTFVFPASFYIPLTHPQKKVSKSGPEESSGWNCTVLSIVCEVQSQF